MPAVELDLGKWENIENNINILSFDDLFNASLI